MSKAKRTLSKFLLICGILSSLLYCIADILGGTIWVGYNFTSQYVSELLAINSPSRTLVFPLFIVDNFLVIAFGFGVWISAQKKLLIQIIGYLLIGIGIIGLITTIFFPMHLRDSDKTYTDTMHIVMSVIGVILILLAIGFGIAAYKNWFRFFSVGILLTFILPAIPSLLVGIRNITVQSTPWVGIMERSNIYGYLLWVLVLAIILMCTERNSNLIRDDEMVI